MKYQERDTVCIIRRNFFEDAPINGMRGFIDHVHGDGYYTFVALTERDGIIKGRKVGEGGCHEKYLKPDNGEDLIDAMNTLLYERELQYNKLMGGYYLRKIIEEDD